MRPSTLAAQLRQSYALSTLKTADKNSRLTSRHCVRRRPLVTYVLVRACRSPSPAVPNYTTLSPKTADKGRKLTDFQTSHFSTCLAATWLLGFGYVRLSTRPSTLAALLRQSYALSTLKTANKGRKQTSCHTFQLSLFNLSFTFQL